MNQTLFGIVLFLFLFCGCSHETYVTPIILKMVPNLYLETPDSVYEYNKINWTKNCTALIEIEKEKMVDLGQLSIRGRGNSSSRDPKKPYAIKFDQAIALLGMPADKRWDLVATYIDITNLRNAIAYELARNTTSLEWTPRGEFVNLYLNGSYVGNFYLCEHIKRAKNRVNINRGGYILEFDAWYDEVNKFRTDSLDLPVMIKEPDQDDLTKDEFEYIQGYVNKVEQYLINSNEDNADEILYLLDIDTFVDWWFISEIAQNGEVKWPKSSYMYKEPSGKLKAGPVWDFDYGTFVPNKSKWICINSIWYKYLFQNSFFRKRVVEKWEASKSTFYNIIHYIDIIASFNRESAIADMKKWPIPEEDIDVNGDKDLSYDEAVERIKQSVLDRIIWIDENIKKLCVE